MHPTTTERGALAGLLALLITALLGAPAHAQLRVITTTTDLADMTRAIGGAHVKVDAICKGEQDPHYVQARPSYVVGLNRADLLVAVGLDLEVGWLPSLIRSARNPAINPGKPGYLDASTAVTPIDVPTGPVDRSAGDVHPRGNPHYWLDPRNGRKVAASIADRLAQLDAEHAAEYRAGLSRFTASLDRAITRWDARMAPLRGAKVVSYHATFNYFIQRYGLSSQGYVESRPGIPPAPAHLAQLVQHMRQQRVRAVLHERYHDRSASELVARRGGGAALLELPTSVGGAPGVDSYVGLIDHLVGRVAGALEAKP